MPKRPGGELAARPLHFFLVVDCSGSMAGNKIQSLNNAVREVLPHMKRVADDNPNAEVLLRVLGFSSGARWHVGQPTTLENFEWRDLQADGVTDLGLALEMLAQELQMPPMEQRALPPVLVLISDGQPTDDFAAGLKQLLQEPWGAKAVRVAIAIGEDADHEVLQRFINNVEFKPLQANNPEALVNMIKWASTNVLKAAASPGSMDPDAMNNQIPLPAPPPVDPDAEDVW